MGNRREIWRDFMGRFEPSADPRDAIVRGFYVPRPGRSIAEQLSARFELKPAASHLLMGGVGSGKTTQLLVARDRLAAHEDTDAVYVDVSLRVEPNRVTENSLLAIVGIELGQRVGGAMPELQDELIEFEAFLDPSEPLWDHDPSDHFVDVIRRLLGNLRETRRHHVLLVDSLDRMSNLKRFAGLVEGAVTKLGSLGIGVILIGPLTALYGVKRTSLDRFDRTWHLPSVDVNNDEDGHRFLIEVLTTRDVNHLLSPAAVDRLAVLSGGVLRDLVALTQAAGEEAYVDGADHVEIHHVETAAEIFGRKQLFAIDSHDLAVLQRVRTKGTFVQTSEKDLALLATRRVLEYANGHARFAVHPTIEPLLAQIPEVA